MTKPKQIISGKLWANRTSREVLWSILKVKDVEFGVLRICAPNKKIDGDIGILRGIYLIGGAMRGQNTKGYDVIKLLLELKEGQFQYLDFENTLPVELDQGFKIRITDAINVLPEMPPTLEEMTGKNTLNRIRGFTPEEVPSEEALIDQKALAQLQSWERRSMRLRAAAFWALFVVVSSMAALLYYFQK